MTRPGSAVSLQGCASAAGLAEEIRPSALATTVSNLISPPVLTTAALIVTARLSLEPWAMDLASSYWLVSVLAPFLVLVFLVRRGVIGDLDIRRRDQRAVPLAVTAFCQALGFGFLLSAAASAELLRLAGALLLLTLILLVVSRWWKISVHAGAAALVFSHHFLLAGDFLPLLLGLPLLIWSRLRLRHHTLGQTLMGSSVGIMLALLFLILFPGG